MQIERIQQNQSEVVFPSFWSTGNLTTQRDYIHKNMTNKAWYSMHKDSKRSLNYAYFFPIGRERNQTM